MVLNNAASIFTGFPFGPDHPYSDGEARELVRGLTAQLRGLIAISPSMAPLFDTDAEKMDTGAWDVIPLRASDGGFTKRPHLTVSATPGAVHLQLTLPNGAPRVYWRNLRHSTEVDFNAGVAVAATHAESLHRKLKYGVWEPRLWLSLVQRHFHARQYDIDDGRIAFSIDSSAPASTDTPVKPVLAWLPALRSLLRGQNGANYQFEVQFRFAYGEESLSRSAEFGPVLAGCSEALLPMLDLIGRGTDMDHTMLRRAS
jgi:hypothetical protein